MSDGSTDKGERTVWQPTHAVAGQGTVRVIGPSQDAAEAAIHAELLEIAERSLADPAAAERLVSKIVRTNGQLVVAASHTAASAQREAAKNELARLVRRAALDTLPPLATTAPGTESLAAKALGKKLRPVAKVATPALAQPASQPAGRGVLPLLLVLLVIGGGVFLLSRDFWPPSDQLFSAILPDALLPDAALPDTARPIPPPAPAETAAATPAPAGQEGAPEPDASTAGDLLKLEAGEPGMGRLDGQSGAATSSTAPPVDVLPAVDAADLRVFILYPDGAEEMAGELYATLSESGQFPLVVLRDVEFAIATPRIRYFFTEDGDSADALADVLRQQSGGGQWTVQDFTQFRPLPAPGTLEIFIPAA